MSIISCTEPSCIYQKNGQCNLNSVSDFYYKQSPLSQCIYYQEKDLIKKYILSNSNNQGQTS